jgi:transmembrane sensor
MGTVVELPDRKELATEAAQWLIRLDADTPPSQQELSALGEWLHRSPAHREELESLAALWGRLNILTELAVPLGNASRTQPLRQLLWRWTGPVLAAMAAAAALVAVLITRGPALDPLLETNGLYATAVGQQSVRHLADGSQVMLNTNSQIKVEYGDTYRRVYLLQGEALFTVAKNPERPFRVYAGSGLIEAVGTAFSVHLRDTQVDVAVTEGRVSLASINPARVRAAQQVSGGSAPEEAAALDETTMQSLGFVSAGEVATIRSPSAEPTAGSVAVLQDLEPIPPQALAQRLAWSQGVLMFSGETLENVVKELGRYTTVSIEITDESIRNMRVGGRFPVGETETMLAALESNFNLRVIRVSHNRVLLAPANH